MVLGAGDRDPAVTVSIGADTDDAVGAIGDVEGSLLNLRNAAGVAGVAVGSIEF